MIPLFRPSFILDDLKCVGNVLGRAWDWAEGQEIEEFEAGLCQYLSIPGVLVCNSGTSALHMAVVASGVKHFHEVIVPSFTFIATANAVRFVGATPVFADIEPDTYGLDPQDVEKRITKKTKAIVAVHYAGQSCQIFELRKLANKHGLILIEDCAEALGATYNNIHVGKFGHCAILSFCQNKIISTGEGGALITDSKFIYDQAKLVRSHGRLQGTSFDGSLSDYTTLGYNFRMPSMNAALGISQLSRVTDLIRSRLKVAGWYFMRLSDIPNLVLPRVNTQDVFNFYTIRVTNGKRDYLMNSLASKGIASKVYFHPVHLTAYYKRQKWEVERLPVTEQMAKEVLSLPMYPDMSESDVEAVCCAVKECLV